MKSKHLQKTQTHRPDLLLLAATILLVLFGLLMIYNASPFTSARDFGDSSRLARLQIIWAVGGAFVAFIIYKINYKFWEKLAPLLMVGALVLLLAVFIPGLGIEIYGAQRWIGIGRLFAVQPSEFAKLAYLVYLAAFLTKRIRFWPFATVTVTIIAILLAQRDLGTAAIISMTGAAVYFLAGAPLVQFLLFVPAGIAAGIFFILSSDYRRQRLFAFLNPSSDPSGSAYHVNQILIALGSAGWFGVGLGQSSQKFGYIPEVTTDSIFAIIGNEVGFFGSFIFVCLFFFIVFRAFRIAAATTDTFGQLLAAGIGVWIGLQTFVNLAGMVALLPLKGVPLPLISYGGSSLLAVFFAVAILLNISKNTTK